jgi:hypothetical protein
VIFLINKSQVITTFSGSYLETIPKKNNLFYRQMRTLLLAAILYLIGVVIILFMRPGFMFDEDGRWKEFGSLSRDHTMFPFWLFCISWAVLSYCITMYFMSSKTEPAETISHSSNSRSGKRSKSGKKGRTPAASEDLVEPLPPITAKKEMKPMKPGYYVLNDSAKNTGGAPKYVYYGAEPPEFMGEE